jgi:hypothetical protein
VQDVRVLEIGPGPFSFFFIFIYIYDKIFDLDMQHETKNLLSRKCLLL